MIIFSPLEQFEVYRFMFNNLYNIDFLFLSQEVHQNYDHLSFNNFVEVSTNVLGNQKSNNMCPFPFSPNKNVCPVVSLYSDKNVCPVVSLCSDKNVCPVMSLYSDKNALINENLYSNMLILMTENLSVTVEEFINLLEIIKEDPEFIHSSFSPNKNVCPVVSFCSNKNVLTNEKLYSNILYSDILIPIIENLSVTEEELINLLEDPLQISTVIDKNSLIHHINYLIPLYIHNHSEFVKILENTELYDVIKKVEKYDLKENLFLFLIKDLLKDDSIREIFVQSFIIEKLEQENCVGLQKDTIMGKLESTVFAPCPLYIDKYIYPLDFLLTKEQEKNYLIEIEEKLKFNEISVNENSQCPRIHFWESANKNHLVDIHKTTIETEQNQKKGCPALKNPFNFIVDFFKTTIGIEQNQKKGCPFKSYYKNTFIDDKACFRHSYHSTAEAQKFINDIRNERFDYHGRVKNLQITNKSDKNMIVKEIYESLVKDYPSICKCTGIVNIIKSTLNDIMNDFNISECPAINAIGKKNYFSKEATFYTINFLTFQKFSLILLFY
jgi:hypothetical protein